MTPQVYNKPSRALYHQTLSDPNSGAWTDLKQMGSETNLPMEVLLRKKCGPIENGMPGNVLYDMMAREEIYPASSWTRPALKVEDCLNTPFRANLLFAHWDKLFHQTLWRNSEGTKGAQFAQTADQLTPGSVYRPYGDLPVINRRRRTPLIRIEQLVADVITQEDDLIRATGFTVDGGLERLVKVPESGDFPEVSFTVDQDASGMKKVGISLKQSRESKFREAYVQTVNDVVMQIAELQATALTTECLTDIYQAWDATENPVKAIASSAAGLVRLATEIENGYAPDTIVMLRGEYENFALAAAFLNHSGSNVQALPVGAENRAPGMFSQFQSLNEVESSFRYGFVTSDQATTASTDSNGRMGATAWTGTRKLAFDSSSTINMHQQAQGMVDEEVYMVPTQDYIRVISFIYGLKLRTRQGIWQYT